MQLIGLFSDDWKIHFSPTEHASGDLQEKAGKLEGKIWEKAFPLPAHTEVAVFLESMLSGKDFFPAEFRRYSRLGTDRAESLHFAFELAFEKGYRHFVFVQTIVPNSSTEILHRALLELQAHDVVMAPDEDGSAPVFGINVRAFERWSQFELMKPEIVVEMLSDCHSLNLKSKLLPEVLARRAWDSFGEKLRS